MSNVCVNELQVDYELCKKANQVDEQNQEHEKSCDMYYKIHDVPPWYLSIAFGFQHSMVVLRGVVTNCLLVGQYACLKSGSSDAGYFLSTSLFVSGISTLLQVYLGTRLPLVQASASLFIAPTFAFLSLPEWKCSDTSLVTSGANETTAAVTDDWTLRIRELQGAYMVASLVEILLGLTGLVGFLMRFISPLTISVFICLISLGLFEKTSFLASGNWFISLFVASMMILFTQYLNKVPLYYVSGWRRPEIKKIDIPVFQLFPVLLSIGIAWIICCILTMTSAVDENSLIRVERSWSSLQNTNWFSLPYPGQWGWPRISVSSTVGFILGVIASTCESIGDYHSCSELVGAPQIPKHAINRGIMVEGLATFLVGLFGASGGSTSYTSDISNIRATKVGSRVVVLWCGVVLIAFGVIPKVGSFFAMVPIPIVGGLTMFFFSVILGVGLSNLSYVPLNRRNTFVVGVSLFFGMSIPQWVQKQKGTAFRTGFFTLDQILTVLFSINFFVGGLLSVFFDNTIPGTLEERGITQWRKSRGDKHCLDKCYAFPIISKWLERHSWFSRIPISPSYPD